MARIELLAAEAVKAFKTRPSVQVARRVMKKDKDTNKDRPSFETKAEPLAAEHVIGAAKYDDGRVVVVTVDGKRHTAATAASRE